MILPYYRIKKTEEGKQFFFANRGYFNFWDEYLIMNIDEGHNKVFSVLVNRTSRKFSGKETRKYKKLKCFTLKNLSKKESRKKCLKIVQN